MKCGKNQQAVLEVFADAGCYIVGEQSWRSNVLANLGEKGVKEAGARGDPMDRGIVVEQTLTLQHLEWRIAKRKALLDAVGNHKHPGSKRARLERFSL